MKGASPTLLSPAMESYALEEWHDYYSEIVDLVPEGSKVLDVGSGRGGLAAWLRDHRGCAPTCIDASVNALEACRDKGLTSFLINIDDDELPRGRFVRQVNTIGFWLS